MTNLRRPFYQNLPLAYLPFSLSSSVLVLIRSVRQGQVRYVAQCELRRDRIGEAAVVTGRCAACEDCAVQPAVMLHIPEAAEFHLEMVWR